MRLTARLLLAGLFAVTSSALAFAPPDDDDPFGEDVPPTAASKSRPPLVIKTKPKPADPPQPRPKTEAPQKKRRPPAATVTLIDEKTHRGRPRAIEQGQLVFSVGGKTRNIPLDEIIHLSVDAGSALSVVWLGQDGHDVARIKGAAKGAGVQDIHLALAGLRGDSDIRQLVVTADGGGRWQLSGEITATRPSSGGGLIGAIVGVFGGRKKGPWKEREERTVVDESQRWRAILRRVEGTDRADLFIEPNGKDRFGKQFAISVVYKNGKTDRVKIKAATHTDSKKKLPKTSVARPHDRIAVFLEGGDRLYGKLISLDKDSLHLSTSWQSKLSVPLLQVLAVRFDDDLSADDQARFQALLEKAGTSDQALVRGRDGPPVSIAGHVEHIADGKLRFEFQGQSRTINQPRLLGLVLAAHPPVRQLAGRLHQTFRLVGGEIITGHWVAADEDHYEIETAWQQRITLPAASVRSVRFRGGRLEYLSDLRPIRVVEVPYFGRTRHHQRDKNLNGEPIKLGGKSYRKGLAVYSRCLLTYAIDGQFETFKAVLGLDETAKELGRVDFRIIGDGRTLLERKDLRGGDDPLPISLSVSGVKRLVLEIDFGKNEDIGDHVIWADARLLRAASK